MEAILAVAVAVVVGMDPLEDFVVLGCSALDDGWNSPGHSTC